MLLPPLVVCPRIFKKSAACQGRALAGLAPQSPFGFLGRPDYHLVELDDSSLFFGFRRPFVHRMVSAAALGTGIWSVLLATAVIQVPGIARIIRTATLEQSVRGFVEVAVLRGETTPSILRREILPNIAGPISADIGLRFTWSVILIASVNFLGLGLQPPGGDLLGREDALVVEAGDAVGLVLGLGRERRLLGDLGPEQ